MKGQKEQSFLKGKGFYVSLLAGASAIVIIAAVILNLTASKEEQNLVDLNEQTDGMVKNEIKEESGSALQTTEKKSETNVAKVDPNSQVELEGYEATATMNNSNKTKLEDEKKNLVKENSVVKKIPVKKTAKTFNKELGLSLPIGGDVILDYSANDAIYFKTLDQYKCNPAIVIKANVGENVKAAADGVVKNITKNEETGVTLTMSIGDNYSLVYGQLSGVNLEEGANIKAGDVIGKIAKPTKYYIEEGPNLYFQVNNKEKSVNPHLYLK